MIYLTILALVSLFGALFMLSKRINEIAPHVENAGRYAHTNFIFEFFRVLRKRVIKAIGDLYLNIRPHLHDFMAGVASKMYKISSWLAGEFLKFYNFIQGRKVLKSSGKTSIFIRDIASVKRGR